MVTMTLQLKVPKMACSACVNTIAKAVQSIDPAANVEADPKTKLVKIQTVKPESAIREAIADAGYPAA
ncbi:conserved hypothetical protein [Kamptonema sp. PCC 6506]|nr:conserved hypothetical protein [Kamptonema sp. PCC 6506]